MRRTGAVVSVVGAVILSFWAVSDMAAQHEFSGTWVLDKARTHGLASELKSYTMVVAQTESELAVQTGVEGDLRSLDRGPGDGPPGEGGPPPGGPEDSGPPGGPEGGGPPEGVMALRTMIPKATYSLSGQVTTIDLEPPGHGGAKLKAKWSKDGKTLELSTARNMTLEGASGTVTTKERWTLADSGETLKVQRSVETPMGVDSVRLTFRRSKTEPQALQ